MGTFKYEINILEQVQQKFANNFFKKIEWLYIV